MNIDGNTPILSETAMRDLGFTDHVPERWYLVSRLSDTGITLNITIDKATGDYEEYVLDEYICQPYPYSSLNCQVARDTRKAVDREVARLREAGLTIDVNHGAYRFPG